MTSGERVRLYRKQVADLKRVLANLPSGSIAERRVAAGLLVDARDGLRRATLEAIRDDNRGGAA